MDLSYELDGTSTPSEIAKYLGMETIEVVHALWEGRAKTYQDVYNFKGQLSKTMEVDEEIETTPIEKIIETMKDMPRPLTEAEKKQRQIEIQAEKLAVFQHGYKKAKKRKNKNAYGHKFF